nr:MAG TPA: hypothetical protein [Caudoviricetes sp.]
MHRKTDEKAATLQHRCKLTAFFQGGIISS